MLLKAAQENNVDNAKVAINEGAILKSRDTRWDSNGWSALHWAASYGNDEIIKCILQIEENRKQINDRSAPAFMPLRPGYETALDVAIRYGRVTTIKLLEENGAKQSVECTSRAIAMK